MALYGDMGHALNPGVVAEVSFYKLFYLVQLKNNFLSILKYKIFLLDWLVIILNNL